MSPTPPSRPAQPAPSRRARLTTSTPARILGLALALLAFAGPQPADAEPSEREKRRQQVLDQVDTVATEVAKLRGLAQKRPIKRGVMTKDAIEKRLLTRLDEEYSADELAAEDLTMKRLGLLDPEVNYKDLVIGLLTDQIAGFYDPVERHLYIADEQVGGVPGAEGMLLAHEIDHALQDQHFDLRVFMKPNKTDNDESVARQALVEGDGTALMIEYLLAQMNLPPPWHEPELGKMLGPQLSSAMGGGELAKAPMFLRESLIFPYLGGLQFVAHFRKTHAWDRVDAMYRKPPLSTEHILHPEKYQSYERPDLIAATPIPALRGHKRVYNNVNGELGMALLLSQHLFEPRRGDPPDSYPAMQVKIDEAVAGWGGDRLAVYAPAGHQGGLNGVVGISYSVWDQPADAIEFFERLAEAMPEISLGDAIATTDSRISYRDERGYVHTIERRKDAVVMVLGADAKQSDAIRTQVWKRWRVTRR